MSPLDYGSVSYRDVGIDLRSLNAHPALQRQIAQWGPIVQVRADAAYCTLIATFANGMKQTVSYETLVNYYQHTAYWTSSTAYNTVPNTYYSYKIDNCCTPEEADTYDKKPKFDSENETRRKTKLCLCSEHLWK